MHILTGGNIGNQYISDEILKKFGDSYFYTTFTLVFVYDDDTYQFLSAPVLWDWRASFLNQWKAEKVMVTYAGQNPVRQDAGIFHISFFNPEPAKNVKNILLSDGWLRDYPYSDIFAVTLKSQDYLAAIPKKDIAFSLPEKKSAQDMGPDTRNSWDFANDFDGWISGCSDSWDAEAEWTKESYGQKGAATLPACLWGADKYTWIEKKISIPPWGELKLEFSRHSGSFSNFSGQWSDGLLKVIVFYNGNEYVVYERLYSGDWCKEWIDLGKYKGETVVIRFENHGGGKVTIGEYNSPTCDGEEAIISEIKLIGQ